MLGAELSLLLERAGVSYIGTGHEVDIQDPRELAAFARGKTLKWIVNCAAYTAVDTAEDEEALAFRRNAAGPENLARQAVSSGARLLHVSTDYVFSGDGTRPYQESDPIDPRCAYGRTKAAGEARVMAVAPDSVIVRTAWLYGEYGPNFVRTMLRLMAEKESVGVVDDQRGDPTWTRDLAEAIKVLVRIPSVPGGVYHFAGEGDITWYDFACEIHRLGREYGILARDCRIRPLHTEQYPTKARRPVYSVLNKDKVRGLGVRVPDWRESLRAFFDELTRTRGK